MEVLTKSTQKKETAEFIKVCMSVLKKYLLYVYITETGCWYMFDEFGIVV